MARDTRIDWTKRDPKPQYVPRPLSTSDRIELLLSDVLGEVSRRIEDKHSKVRPDLKR